MGDLPKTAAVDLGGQVAVIIGGGWGARIAGRAIASANGFPIFIDCDPEAAQEAVEALRAEHLVAHAYDAELSDAADVHATLAAIEEAFGPLDLVINCVAPAVSLSLCAGGETWLSTESLRREMALTVLNVAAEWWTMQSRTGRILNIAWTDDGADASPAAQSLLAEITDATTAEWDAAGVAVESAWIDRRPKLRTRSDVGPAKRMLAIVARHARASSAKAASRLL